jgi:Glycolipid 2-alpha-mannosyltransferase
MKVFLYCQILEIMTGGITVSTRHFESSPVSASFPRYFCIASNMNVTRKRPLILVPGQCACAALLLTIVCSILRGTQQKVQSFNHNQSSEPSAAIVYLAGGLDEDIFQLNQSLVKLDKHFISRHSYPVIILHDDFNSSTRTKLGSALTFQPVFRKVQLEMSHQDQQVFGLNLSTMHSTWISRGKWNYQNMCRFWFKSILLETSPISDYDVIVRFDTDSVLTKSVPSNFIAEFIDGGFYYGFNQVSQDCLPYSDGLGGLAQSFAANLSGAPVNALLWASVKSHTQCVPLFYNNFEMLSLRFFREHEGVRKWLDAVDRNGGIYRSRWGDAPLRYTTAALFVPLEKIKEFNPSKFPYAHY